ncbi:MAG: hypothetical protein AAF587_36415 [Bacteroidota bacterium]
MISHFPFSWNTNLSSRTPSKQFGFTSSGQLPPRQAAPTATVTSNAIIVEQALQPLFLFKAETTGRPDKSAPNWSGILYRYKGFSL